MGVVADLQTYLVAQGIAGGSTEWDILRRRQMDDPVDDQLVSITEDGGNVPELDSVVGIGDSAFHDTRVLVTVRAGAWKGGDSASKAQEILDDLHGKRSLALDVKVYLRIRAMTPEPIFLGFDDQGRPRHTIAFMLLSAA